MSSVVRKRLTARKRLLPVGTALLVAMLGLPPNVQAKVPQSLRVSMTTDKARYAPGESVQLQVSIMNPSNQTVTGNVYLVIHHLNQQIAVLPGQSVSLAAKSTRLVTVSWHPPTSDYQGYLVQGMVQSGKMATAATFETAIDVSSNWTRFPRYGFVSEYPKMSKSQMTQELDELNNYHIDGLQFYDWQWKHDVPLAGTVAKPAAAWHDIAGRTNYRQTVSGLIQTGHKLGMESFNYNLLYGAWAGYQTDGSGVKPAWGLYSDNGGNLQVSFGMPGGWSTSAIDVFNPANLGWRQYILRQETKVFQAYAFDGWQVDQLGDQGLVFDAKGKPVDVEASFAPFLNDAVNTLHKQVIFNDVGGYGLSSVVADSKESVAYIECWPGAGQVTLGDLQNTINAAGILSQGKKSTVLAAYLDSDYANGFSSQNPGYFNEPGVLLADATIFASGGDHIELGDNLQMLNAPYFPNHNLIMNSGLKAHLLSDYNFMVAYENLLRGGLKNTTNTTLLKGHKTSTDGSTQTVWTFSKTNRRFDVLQLINLIGENDNFWQDSSATQPAPKTLRNMSVKYYVGKDKVKRVFVASPDASNGATQVLRFSAGHDRRGNYVQFTLPSLEYWDMVYMQK